MRRMMRVHSWMVLWALAASTANTAAQTPGSVTKAPSVAQVFRDDALEILWVAHAGEHRGDQYGWQCEAIGDLDGDGASEVVTSAPFSNRSGPGRHGKAFVFDGSTGEALKELAGQRSGGGFGFRLHAAGDFDGDDTPDYLVTEAGIQGQTVPDQTGPGFRGYVHLYSGRTHEALLTLEGPDPAGRFGMAVSMLPDLDGDDRMEIIAGACQSNLGGERSGAAYIFGRGGAILRTHTVEAAGSLFGNGITRIDDITGDGVDDYAIAAFGEGPTRQGRVHVFDGAGGHQLYVIDPSRYARGKTAVDFGRFFLSLAGDVDGDGVSELYIGDWFDRSAGNITGRVWAISTAVPKDGVPAKLIRTIDGQSANEWLGFGRGFPDVDGDGCAELLICSNGHEGFSGAVGLYSGRTGKRLRWIASSQPGHLFGYDACSPGDLNGDGLPDIIVTAAGAQGDGEGRFGSTYAIEGLDHR
ncbi:MAG: FG-GAP-like repeat-containing protein [Planctomycetota bacterium]